MEPSSLVWSASLWVRCQHGSHAGPKPLKRVSGKKNHMFIDVHPDQITAQITKQRQINWNSFQNHIQNHDAMHFLAPQLGKLFTKSVFFSPRNFPNAQSTFRVSHQKRPGWFWQMGHLWAWPRWPKLRGCTALDITQHDPAACVERLLPFLEMDTARPQGCWLLTWFTWMIFNRSVGNCLPNLHIICNWFIRVEKCASPNKFLASVAGLMGCGLIALGIRKPLSYTEIA